MKIVSYIFAAIAAFNFVGILATTNASSEFVYDRLRAIVMFGILAALIYHLQNKKEGQAKKAETPEATPKLSYWDNYVKHHYDNAMAIKTLTKAPFSVMDDKDVEETIQSIEDWSQSIGCPIANLKAEFLKNFTKTYSMEEIKGFLKVLEEEEIYKEASQRQISSDNTCTNYMIIWLKEYIKQEEETRKKKQEEMAKAKEEDGKKPQLLATNRMTAKELIRKENAAIEFFQHPTSGKIFFACGSKKGYVSPAVAAKYQTIEIDEMQYAEVSKDGGIPVPTLMMAGKHNNIVRTIPIPDEFKDLP